MKKLDINLISIEFTIISTINPGVVETSDEDFIQNIKGSIMLDDGFGKKLKVGTIDGIKVLVESAINSGHSLHDLWDSSHEVSTISSAIHNKHFNIHSGIVKFYKDNIFYSDVLILDRIKIRKKFRGNRIGEYAIKNFYKQFSSGCCIMALHAFPLQFESSPSQRTTAEMSNYEAQFEAAKESLYQYYKSLGLDAPRKNFPGIFTVCTAMKSSLV